MEISIRSKKVYLTGFKCFVSGAFCTERNSLRSMHLKVMGARYRGMLPVFSRNRA